MSPRTIMTAAAALLANAVPALAQPDFPAEQVERGRTIARMGDCIACHTVKSGRDFSGGMAMPTPIGTIYSTNITPDRKTGIGDYSFQDFARAVQHGIRRDGSRLYAAMPYPSYARIEAEDMTALYAYFMAGVPAVERANRDSDIPWPLNLRWPLALWDAAFADQAAFVPDPNHDAQWNRGAYLVQGPGHCGACHTPRGIGYQEKAMTERQGTTFLAGARIAGWYAKNLRGDGTDGLRDWSPREIADFLRTGRNGRTAAFGDMADVITHSTQHLTPSDAEAIAVYLKSLSSSRDAAPGPAAGTAAAERTRDLLRSPQARPAGATLYGEYCLSCHRANGQGFPKIFPALAGNSAVLSPDPTSAIRIVLEGGRMVSSSSEPFAVAMPEFSRLTDQQLADVISFMRTGWGNGGGAVTASDVAGIRKVLPATAAR